ncbi:MAG TPA: major capsid protein [Armatimonadota bacterium]|jgi:hypothetical protein
MDPILDVFGSDAFSVISLTAAINKMPFVPGRAGRLGIFEESGVPTTSIALEELAGTIALIPNTARGAVVPQNTPDKRTMRTLTIPHLPVQDTVKADELQNVRAFGQGAGLSGAQATINQRMQRMTTALDATLEYGRIGAIKGVIYDSNGSTVIYNLFTEFGVTQSTTDFVLGTTTTDIIGKCTDTAGVIEDELGAGVYDHIHVFCGKTFWKSFISHTAVKDAFKYFEQTGQNMNPLREDLRYKGFQFGGMVFEQYRGKVGSVGFVADAEAHAFPVGVPGLFQTAFAPADYVETANTIGLPRYAKIGQDPSGMNKFVLLETQTNPLSICTRPKVLVKLTTSN